MKIYEKLLRLQQGYSSKKESYNPFGKFNYRSAEQMLTELKPLLSKEKLIISFKEEHISEDYLRCTVSLIDVSDGERFETSSDVLTDRAMKGMSLPQCSGAAISYIRKYALCGLLAVTDSSSDPDAISTFGNDGRNNTIEEQIDNCHDNEELKQIWNNLTTDQQKKLKPHFTKRKNEIS